MRNALGSLIVETSAVSRAAAMAIRRCAIEESNSAQPIVDFRDERDAMSHSSSANPNAMWQIKLQLSGAHIHDGMNLASDPFTRVSRSELEPWRRPRARRRGRRV